MQYSAVPTTWHIDTVYDTIASTGYTAVDMLNVPCYGHAQLLLPGVIMLVYWLCYHSYALSVAYDHHKDYSLCIVQAMYSAA